MGIKMKLFLAMTLLAGVMTHPDHGEFNKWAKNEAMESCWGEENMKIWTVRMKKAVAKCSQQDEPELLLPQFRAPYKTVNALLEGQEEEDEEENSQMQMMFHMFKFMNMMHQNQNRNNYNQFRPYSKNYDSADNMPMPMKWMVKMMMKSMHHGEGSDMDFMQRRDMDDDHVDAQEYFFKKMMKNAHYNKMGNHQSNNHNHQKHGMYDMYDMKNSDMDFSDMFHSRHSELWQAILTLETVWWRNLKAQRLVQGELSGAAGYLLPDGHHPACPGGRGVHGPGRLWNSKHGTGQDVHGLLL